MRVWLRNGYTQAYTQIMQHTHMHKAVTRRVEAKKLLSRQRQSNYSCQISNSITCTCLHTCYMYIPICLNTLLFWHFKDPSHITLVKILLYITEEMQSLNNTFFGVNLINKFVFLLRTSMFICLSLWPSFLLFLVVFCFVKLTVFLSFIIATLMRRIVIYTFIWISSLTPLCQERMN